MSWRTILLGDLVEKGQIELQTGPFGTQLRASDYTASGIPVINVRNIGYGVLRAEKLEYVPDEVVHRLEQHLLEENDIVFGRKGAVDRHLLVGREQSGWMQGSDCIRLRLIGGELNAQFLSFALRTERHRSWMLSQCSNKATMASLNQDVIRRIPLSVPIYDTQVEVARILSTYYELMDNNTRRLQLLEGFVRLLYREWFVNNKFPGHEHVRITDGIPEDWHRAPVSSFYKTTSGGTPSRTNPDYFTGDINWIKTQELNNGFLFETQERITEEAIARSAAKVFPEKTVVVAMYGATIGETAILGAPAATNQACCALLPNHASANYMHAYLYLLENKQRLIGLAQGSAQNNISQEVIRNIPMTMPTGSLMRQFVDYVEPSFEQMKNLYLQNLRLQSSIDILLPRLVAGRIAV